MKEWYTSLITYVHQLLYDIRRAQLLCKIYYIPIFIRPWWLPDTRKLAGWLNHLVLGKVGHSYRVKEVKIRNIFNYRHRLPASQFRCDEIMPGLLETDDVHLSQWSY